MIKNLLQVFFKNNFLKGSRWFWKGSMVGSQPGSLSLFGHLPIAAGYLKAGQYVKISC